ncbi:maestro heat-like repeat-containing protein family member 7 isoform X2 [Cyanistes caeruleus]|uniref:maestro heat-like repeat-containing protein family member 7 isoform X2 n=1 Tax=Cyanistes caeruleus TaxID=156563 RepID=UPI000CDA6130|nr:maestro heat-like repeat-containing protein family member 7 isoform X2 [Cyanistes caeruleus]
MAGRFLSLFRKKKTEGPGTAPAQQPEEPEQFQTCQDDAAMDPTREQQPARDSFHRTLKMFWKFVPIQHRKTSTTATEGTDEPDSGLTELSAEPDVSPDSAKCSENSDTSATEDWAKALLISMTEDVVITYAINRETRGITKTEISPDSSECSEDSDSTMNDHRAKAVIPVIEHMAIANTNTGGTQRITNTDTTPTPTVIHTPIMDFFEESAVSSLQQVPDIVRTIHQSIMFHVTVCARLQINILRLAEEHPDDVVLSLLHCAPTCDRAATMMWRVIASSGPTLQKVLPTLLCVMEHWPLYRMCTTSGDNKDVFALAAALVLWVIVPQCHKAVIPYSGRLFVALLFHVVITTQQMPPEEVGTFWKACKEEHCLPSNPNRFAVKTMKTLLHRLRCDKELMTMERKGVWDMLVSANTQHYGTGLMARELRRIFVPLCSLIALHLLRLLNREETYWDLPFLAFLVEVFECLDLTYGDNILEIMSRHLHSKCRERRRLALKGLLVLSKDPLRARKMCSLSQTLLELLGDAHGYVVSMTLSVLTNILENEHILISSTTAPKLAEALLPLFDKDDIHMQLLSLHLFFKVMDLAVDKRKKPLKRIVRQSLLPLFFHCYDENKRVAKASLQVLLCVTTFLKKKKLKRLLKKKKMWKFHNCLLAQDRKRAAEYARQALPYLESRQEHLREVARRFIGSARILLRGQKEELRFLSEALQASKKKTV